MELDHDMPQTQTLPDDMPIAAGGEDEEGGGGGEEREDADPQDVSGFTSSADVVVASLAANRALVDEHMPTIEELLRRVRTERANLTLEIESMKALLLQCARLLNTRDETTAPRPTVYDAKEMIERVHRANKKCDARMEAWMDAAAEMTENFFIFPVNATINHVTRQQSQSTPVLPHTQHFFPMAVAFDTAIHTSAALPTATPAPPLNMMPVDMFGM